MSDQAEKSQSHGGHKHKHGGGHGHGHGGSHEEHEGAPEWLISFADMVMLMMGFFVILFALNATPAGRNPGGASEDSTDTEVGGVSDEILDFAISIREAFNNPVDLSSTDPKDQPLIRRLLQRAGKSEANDPGLKGREQDVQSIRPSDYYAISGSIPFGENSSELTESGRATVKEVAAKVRGLRLVVEVRAHASSIEALRGSEHAMRLSADRGLVVARALAAAGVDWWQIRLVLAADHDRIQAYPSNRALDEANARVEIIITDQVVPDPVPTKYGDA